MSPTSYQTAPPRGEVPLPYPITRLSHETNYLGAAPHHAALRNTLHAVALFRRKKNQLTNPVTTPYEKMPRPASSISNVTAQGPIGDPTIDALVAKLPYSNGVAHGASGAATIAEAAPAPATQPATETTDVETIEAPTNPAHLPDLYLTPKLERALIALAIHTQQISERLDRVETRLDNAAKVDPDVATKAEVLAVRRHSAQIAAELALLSVELRSEIERAVTPAQDPIISR